MSKPLALTFAERGCHHTCAPEAVLPEIPDVEVYVAALRSRIVGHRLEKVRLLSPFFLRTVDPPLAAFEGATAVGVSRLAKRVAIAFDADLHLVVHLMIAGRLHWLGDGRTRGRPKPLAELAFDTGTLGITEAGSTRRASLHAVRGAAGLARHLPPGVDVLSCSLEEFAAAVRRENRTLKRALTDQRIVAGIGNAYSDEILHRARLSPLMLTSRLDDAALRTLFDASRTTLRDWIDRLARDAGDAFPEQVTAFRPDMAVHGRFGQPCPVCGSPVQRIVYAANECNYCARCQTGGRRLADRALSRLLGEDWPRTLEE
jgi:formamidopyrimidine-DNA glycosylase